MIKLYKPSVKKRFNYNTRTLNLYFKYVQSIFKKMMYKNLIRILSKISNKMDKIRMKENKKFRGTKILKRIYGGLKQTRCLNKILV